MTDKELKSLESLVQQYRVEGWEITISSWPIQKRIEYSYVIKSPRLQTSVTITSVFDESELLKIESESVARQNHHAIIGATLQIVAQDIYKELGLIYRKKLMGNIIEIPEELTINNIVIPLKQ